MNQNKAVDSAATAVIADPATAGNRTRRPFGNRRRRGSDATTTTADPTASSSHDWYQNLNTVFWRPTSLRTDTISTPTWIAQPMPMRSGAIGVAPVWCRRVCDAVNAIRAANAAAVTPTALPGRTSTTPVPTRALPTTTM